jgi:hypothetical protein
MWQWQEVQKLSRTNELKNMQRLIRYTCMTSLLLSSFLISFAQQKGEVLIHKDPLIERLQKFREGKNIGVNTSTSVKPATADKKTGNRVVVKGFRVQIYAGTNRNEAYAEQSRFRDLYKDIDTYISYDEPTYRVKAGDFRTRSEAQQFMQSIRSRFNNVFLFNEDIFVYQ